MSGVSAQLFGTGLCAFHHRLHVGSYGQFCTFVGFDLYVLDQTGFTGHIRRLIRIDVATWKSELLGQWPSTHLFDEQHLTNGPDGLLVLTSSISRLGTHVMVGLRPTDQGFDVDWVRLGDGRALGGPSFNRHGMTVTVDAGGEVRNSVVDRDNLEHRWFDLAECL